MRQAELINGYREAIAMWEILERRWKAGEVETEYTKGVRHGMKNVAKLLELYLESAGANK
jgi:hypothetical protein